MPLPFKISNFSPIIKGYNLWYETYGLQTNKTNIYGVVDNSGNCTQLTDLSGNGNHATYDNTIGTNPTLSGTLGGRAVNGITFDGVQNNLQLPKTLLKNVTGATLFLVCKATSITSATENEIFFCSISGGDGGRFSLSFDNATGRSRSRCRRLDSDVYATTHQVLGNTDVTNPKVYALSVNYSTGTIYLYENSVMVYWDTYAMSTTGNSSNTNSKYASLGNLKSTESGTNYYPFNGVLGSVLLYTGTPLNDAQIKAQSKQWMNRYGISAPADAATQTETTTYLNRLSALGYTAPSASWTTAFNNLIAAEKSAGNFAKTDAWHFGWTETQNPALVDLVNTTKSYALSGTPPSWDTRGFTPNGSSSFITHWINLSSGTTNYAQNSAGLIIYVRKNALDLGVAMGAKDASNNVLKVYPKYDANGYSGVNNATGTPLSMATYTGFGIFSALRTASNSQSFRINTEPLTSEGTVSTGKPNAVPKIGAYNNNGTTAEYYAGQISEVLLTSGTFDIFAHVVNIKTFEAAIGITS